MANPRTIARLEARIHERAAYCLQFEINDPRAGFITITRVELADDVSAGKIHYSVLGDEGDKSRAAHMLQSAAGYIQRQVSGVLSLRRMPRLVWVFDDSVEKAASLDQLIREARSRDRAINPNADDAPLADEGTSASSPSAASGQERASGPRGALGRATDEFDDDDDEFESDEDAEDEDDFVDESGPDRPSAER